MAKKAKDDAALQTMWQKNLIITALGALPAISVCTLVYHIRFSSAGFNMFSLIVSFIVLLLLVAGVSYSSSLYVSVRSYFGGVIAASIAVGIGMGIILTGVNGGITYIADNKMYNRCITAVYKYYDGVIIDEGDGNLYFPTAESDEEVDAIILDFNEKLEQAESFKPKIIQKFVIGGIVELVLSILMTFVGFGILEKIGVKNIEASMTNKSTFKLNTD